MVIFLFLLIWLQLETNTQVPYKPLQNDFLVFLNSNPARPDIPMDSARELQQGHLANIKKLYKEDILKVAGPLKGGGGIFIITAKNSKKAKEALKDDPAIKAGRFILSFHKIQIDAGEICKVAEDVPLANYTLVKYNDQVMNLSFPEDKLIFAASFPNKGGIHIYKEKKEELINSDISTPNDHLDFVKTFWVGKGVFCEN